MVTIIGTAMIIRDVIASFMIKAVTQLFKGVIRDGYAEILLHQVLTLSEQIHQVTISLLVTLFLYTLKFIGEIAVDA